MTRQIRLCVRAWLRLTSSPWPDPFPRPPPRAWRQPHRCSTASAVLWACPTAHGRTSPACPLGVPGADLGASDRGQPVGSPDSRAISFCTCIGSRTPQGCGMTRGLTPCRMLPSPAHERVGALDDFELSGLNTEPVRFPCLRFPTPLRAVKARLGAMMARYALARRDLHPLLAAAFDRRFP